MCVKLDCCTMNEQVLICGRLCRHLWCLYLTTNFSVSVYGVSSGSLPESDINTVTWNSNLITLRTNGRNGVNEKLKMRWMLAFQIDNERKLMVIVNRSVDHPQIPATDQYVRVETYSSEMVIRPHSSFDEVCEAFCSSYFNCSWTNLEVFWTSGLNWDHTSKGWPYWAMCWEWSMLTKQNVLSE